MRPNLHSFRLPGAVPVSFRPRAIGAIELCRAQAVIVLTVANSKGGCGKSTLTLNTAIGYARQGKRVLIVDADGEQGTLRKWPRSMDIGNPTVIACSASDVIDTVARHIGDYDVVLIDTAGRDERMMAAILDISDILVSPVKPAHQDLLELGRFIRVARARDVPTIAVFNEATRGKTAELKQLAAAFKAYGPFLPVAMQQLSSYRRVYPFGRGVLEIGREDPAKENFARVFAALGRAVDRAHAERAGQ